MADDDNNEEIVDFDEMGLDDRILKAIALLGWSKPTLIQEKAIPLALDGKDILARARTGSGKTGGYAIPVIQKILDNKKSASEQSVRALVITPSRELCNQAFKNIQDLCRCCSRSVRCLDISTRIPLDQQKPLLKEKPDIIVSTPSRILAHIQAKNITLKSSLEYLVVDEADLVFSFGYESDMKSLLSFLPQIYQAFLMSATLSDEVKSLKKLILSNPVILKLEESQLPSSSQLTQYHIKCEEEDKFVLIYSLLKLGLVRGKTIIFVNSVFRCYRLKLFLEQFGIICCILNSELPVNSRTHIVNQFNEGLYDYIIAADENALFDPAAQKTKRKRDKESGVSRGIDFQFVSNVINFDFPVNVESYVHRVGRTARVENQGTALSFVSVKENELLDKVEETLKETHPDGENVFKPYQFKMSEIEGFRYRTRDAMRSVTKVAIREARLKEIKSELLNSEKLKAYFEDNPRDLQLLRHDKALHTVKSQQHMKNVPDYIVPPTLRNFQRGNRKRKKDNKAKSGKFASKKQKLDPLKVYKIAELVKDKKKKRR